MKLYTEHTGTKAGFEDYHGEIRYGDHVLSTWNYVKRQKCYISTVKLLDGTVKRLHKGNPASFLPEIKKLIKAGKITLPEAEQIEDHPF